MCWCHNPHFTFFFPATTRFEDMDESNPTLFSKIVLLKDVEITPLMGSTVTLEIDISYTIGKSIAVLFDKTVIGHLDRSAARVVWRHLHSHSLLTAEIYMGVGNWKNQAWFSMMTHSFEIGVKIEFCHKTREDAKLLLAHFTRRKLNCFPGVAPHHCCEVLKPLVCPVKDENGVSSLLFPPFSY